MYHSRIPVIIYLLVCLAALGQLTRGQTNAIGNPEIYTRETSSTDIGYMTTTVSIPGPNGSLPLSQKGILYQHVYGIGDLGSFVFSSESELRFSLEGAFRVGAGVGVTTMPTIFPPFRTQSVRYYIGMVDVFSLDVVPQFTYIFSEGKAITVKLGFTVVNIGALAAVQDKGVFNESGIVQVNLLPLALRPSVVFDMGRSGVGIGFYYNPSAFLSYRYVSEPLFAETERGLKGADSIAKKVAIQLVFTY